LGVSGKILIYNFVFEGIEVRELESGDSALVEMNRKLAPGFSSMLSFLEAKSKFFFVWICTRE
jgi:hypothetical protein